MLIRTISATDLYELLLSGERPEMIDVREPGEFKLGHIPGSKSLPLYQIPNKHAAIKTDKDVVLICQNGIRSVIAQKYLELKYPACTFYALSGGLHFWSISVDHTLPLY